jgi:hypothetical protein
MGRLDTPNQDRLIDQVRLGQLFKEMMESPAFTYLKEVMDERVINLSKKRDVCGPGQYETWLQLGIERSVTMNLMRLITELRDAGPRAEELLKKIGKPS